MSETPTSVWGWIVFIARQYADLFVEGTIVTLEIAIVGTILGFVLGFAVGMVSDLTINKDDPLYKRVLFKALQWICNAYVEVFRDTPMIVQAMIIYFGLRQAGFEINPIPAGILVTVLNTGAYMSETVRAGIKSVDTGQKEGALSMGMSNSKRKF